MNPAGLAMVEGDESALGQCVYDVIAPEYREPFREFNERVCRGERGTLEFDIIGLKGTRRHMETTAVPLPAPQGGFAQLAVTRDVTARKQYEAALREKDERLKLLIDNTKDYAVIISDPEGRVLEWQGAAEQITRLAARGGHRAGRGPPLHARGPGGRGGRRPRWRRPRATGRAENKRWHQRKDGSRFFADGVMTALFDEAASSAGSARCSRTRPGRSRPRRSARSWSPGSPCKRGSSTPPSRIPRISSTPSTSRAASPT